MTIAKTYLTGLRFYILGAVLVYALLYSFLLVINDTYLTHTLVQLILPVR